MHSKDRPIQSVKQKFLICWEFYQTTENNRGRHGYLSHLAVNVLYVTMQFSESTSNAIYILEGTLEEMILGPLEIG